MDSGAESLGGAGCGSGSFLFAIFRRRVGCEGLQKASRDVRNFINGAEKSGFVGLRWLIESADFPHELQRSGANLFRSCGRIEIKECPDVPAHGPIPFRDPAYSERSACTGSTRAARAAGSADAITAAARITAADAIKGSGPGSFTSAL